MSFDPSGVTLVIIAAGRGARLGAATADRPKALTELLGGSLLERSLTIAASLGIGGVTIVTGYRHEAIASFLESRDRVPKPALLHLDRWAAVNNIVSVDEAFAALAGRDLILLNCDVVFDRRILSDLMLTDGECVLAVDTVAPVDAEAMKVEVSEGRLVGISKGMLLDVAAGEFIGISAWRPDAVAAYRQAAAGIIDAGGSHLYYEDVVDALAARMTVGVHDIGGFGWAEIDSADDLPRATDVAAALDAASARG